MKSLIVLAALLAFGGSASAQDTMQVITPGSLTWHAHPVFKGAQTVILLGDPSKAGPVIQRVKFPPNYRVAPHTHSYDEVVTVLSGKFGNAMGDDIGKANGAFLPVGSVIILPKGHAHRVWSGDEEAIVQINYIGPTGVIFLNPADDTRKQ